MANFRFRNAWSDAARTDERFRDRTEPLADGVTGPELDADLGALPASAPSAANPPPVAPTWGSVHQGRRCKVTKAVLTQALELRQAGLSWPAIARHFDCHRMAIYHALRRQSASSDEVRHSLPP